MSTLVASAQVEERHPQLISQIVEEIVEMLEERLEHKIKTPEGKRKFETNLILLKMSPEFVVRQYVRDNIAIHRANAFQGFIMDMKRDYGLQCDLSKTQKRIVPLLEQLCNLCE